MKILESNPIKGEYAPDSFKLEHTESIHLFNETEKEVLISGVVFDESLNLELHFSKRFNDTVSANDYFGQVIVKYPNSQVSVVEKKIKETQVWA